MAKSYEEAIYKLIDAADLTEKKGVINKLAGTNRELVESLSVTWLKNSKMIVGGLAKCHTFLPLGIYIEGWLFPTNRYDAIEIFSGNKFIANAIIREQRIDVYNNFSYFNEKNAGFYCFITEKLELIEKSGIITLLIKREGKTIKKYEQRIVSNSPKSSIEKIKIDLHEKNNILIPTLTNQMNRLSIIAKQMPDYNFVTFIEGMQDSLEDVKKYCLSNGLSMQDLNRFFIIMAPDLLKRNHVPRHSEIDLKTKQISNFNNDRLLCLAAQNFQAKYNVSREYATLFCHECFIYASKLMEAVTPKMLLVWNKFSPWHLILKLVADKLSIPVVYMENGVIPGTLIFETEGQMGESYPATHSDDFCKLEIDENDIKYAEVIWNQLNQNKLNRWIDTDASVYKDEELEKVKQKLNPQWPTILYAAQNDFESGLYPYTEHTKKFHSPIFESSEEAAIYLGKLASKNQWNLIYKRHPMMRGKLIAELPKNIIVSDNINIHDAIDISDLVITILSQTSYVSLIRNKPALMLGYHQLNHKGCIYETNEKEKIESKIFEALNKGFTENQRENFKRHIAQLCRYYLYRDFSNKDITYGKSIDELKTWLNHLINNNVVPSMPSEQDLFFETSIDNKKKDGMNTFRENLTLTEKIIRKKLKICLFNHKKICKIIDNSILKNKYEDTMMFISQIAPDYLEIKNWTIIFSTICHSFASKGEESFEEFLELNNRLNEETKSRLMIETIIADTIASCFDMDKAKGINGAFNTKYFFSQKLFLNKLNLYISDLVQNKEFSKLYALADYYESDAVRASYIMELIFKNNFFDSVLMKKWMQILLNSDNAELLYYFGLVELDRILFVYPESVYDTYYTDRNHLLRRISKLLNCNRLWEKKKENSRTLAMIVVGFHGKNFASARLQAGLANKLNAGGWKVTIYVADTNYISNEEKFIINPSTIRRNFSKEIYQQDHWGMLDPGVEIRYFNQPEDDINRYHRLIDSIYEDAPQAVIDITNEVGIYNIQLKKDFPVISVPLNGYISSSTSSCYIARNIEYVQRQEAIYGKINTDSMAEANLYLPYPIDKQKFDRRKYGFADKDILVVTVGNRLNYEVTRSIQGKMKQLLSENYQLKWILVGRTDKNCFEEMADEIMNKQVVLWGYETNLYKLYNMCDICLDLPRSGGGGSTALAVQCGLPAVIVNCFSDILPFLGEENAVQNFDESLGFVNRLAESRVMRRQLNKAQYKKLMSKAFSINNFAAVIENAIIEQAEMRNPDEQ